MHSAYFWSCQVVHACLATPPPPLTSQKHQSSEDLVFWEGPPDFHIIKANLGQNVV